VYLHCPAEKVHHFPVKEITVTGANNRCNSASTDRFTVEIQI